MEKVRRLPQRKKILLETTDTSHGDEILQMQKNRMENKRLLE